jgi:hypothetical protein
MRVLRVILREPTGMQGRGSGTFSGLYATEGVEQSGWSEHSILATLFATATRPA